jgi:dihydrofolate reductase
MRKLIAWVFMYSLDGLIADEGTAYWDFCWGLPDDAAAWQQKIDIYERAAIHIMGRSTYEGTSEAMTGDTSHPFAGILNDAPKVVFSRTLATADWHNTTVASGDTQEEVARLRNGGEGDIIVWGGIRLWRSLMQLDLIDEFYVDVHPYIAGEGTRLFDGFPPFFRLELVTSTPFSNGVITLHYRRHR